MPLNSKRVVVGLRSFRKWGFIEWAQGVDAVTMGGGCRLKCRVERFLEGGFEWRKRRRFLKRVIVHNLAVNFAGIKTLMNS